MSGSDDDGRSRNWKCLLVALLLFGLSVKPSRSSCSAPSPIKNGAAQLLAPNTKPNPGSGKFPEKAEARIDCVPGFRLSYAEYQHLTCTNGEWKYSVEVDESICGKWITSLSQLTTHLQTFLFPELVSCKGKKVSTGTLLRLRTSLIESL